MVTMTANIDLASLIEKEVTPGIIILTEPMPISGTNKLRALANVHGCLALVELSVKFANQVEGARAEITF